MTIEFRGDRGLALTERCRDLAEFMDLLRRGETESLVHHLKRCPTCRAVAQAAIRGLVSEGIPFEPPAPLKKAAARILRKDEDEEGPSIEVVADREGIRGVAGVAHEIDQRGTRLRCEPPSGAYRLRLEIEALDGVFLLRIAARNPGDGVAVLKDGTGAPVAPARRLENPLAWPALRPGTYLLTLAGAAGIAALRLRLDYLPIEGREV